ncbi:MAG: hypothetical protein ABL934_06715 [Lysobacteraceae bacterium]
MKIFRTAAFAILSVLLTIGIYQFVRPTRVDNAAFQENMPEAEPAVIEGGPVPENRSFTVPREPTIAQSASSISPWHHPVPSLGDVVIAEPSDAGEQSDIDVSMVMADGTTKTFTGAGVMFSRDGKAMAIPKGGYRILADGSLLPDADPGAESPDGPVSP